MTRGSAGLSRHLSLSDPGPSHLCGAAYVPVFGSPPRPRPRVPACAILHVTGFFKRLLYTFVEPKEFYRGMDSQAGVAARIQLREEIRTWTSGVYSFIFHVSARFCDRDLNTKITKNNIIGDTGLLPVPSCYGYGPGLQISPLGGQRAY
ncbi:unnamed protein product [Arctogadus glacialis]